jgi:hypothetical protein
MNTLEVLTPNQLYDYLRTKFDAVKAGLIYEQLISGDDLTTEEVDQYLQKDTFDSKIKVVSPSEENQKPGPSSMLEKILIESEKPMHVKSLANKLKVSVVYTRRLVKNLPPELKTKVERKQRLKKSITYKSKNQKLGKLLCIHKDIYTKIIALDISEKSKFNCFMFLYYLINMKATFSHCSFKQIPSKFIVKKFSSHFYTYSNLLVNEGILLKDDSYIIKNTEFNINRDNHCKAYAINPLYSSFNKNDYINIELKRACSLFIMFLTSSRALENQEKISDTGNTQYRDFYLNEFHKDFSTLKIDRDKLLDRLKVEVESITIEKYKVNERITDNVFKKAYIVNSNGKKDILYPSGEDKNGRKRTVLTRDFLLGKAKLEGKSLIQNKNNVYIMDEEEFVKVKKEALWLTQLNSINKLAFGFLRSKRNKTNNRLDNNFTNISGWVVDMICKDNNLVQLDAANSQFAILGHKLQDDTTINSQSDFVKFQQLVQEGTFYEYIREVLGIDGKAKVKVFEMLFSKPDNNTREKALLKKEFPNIIKWIDNFKKTAIGSEEQKHKQFAIMLQLKESDIFIDNFYKLIKEEGMFCITKHDSVIVREENKDRVKQIMKDYCNKINFKTNIR